MLNVSQGEFLVLLLVMQAQYRAPRCFLINATRKKSVHPLVNVCAESKNLIERGPGERRTQAFLRNLLAKLVVIAVEKPTKLFATRLVVRQEGTQHERFEKPCGMSLVPFHRSGFRTRLNHLIFSRNIRGKSARRRTHGFVLGSDGSVPRVASNPGANSLQTPFLASRCGSTGLSHSVLLRSFSFAHTGLIRMCCKNKNRGVKTRQLDEGIGVTLVGMTGQDPYPVLRDPTGSTPYLGIADTIVQLCGALKPDLITTIAAAELEIVRRKLRRKYMKFLMVLTSHDQLGNTGRKTGFWLEEFAAPYFVFRDAGVDLTLASPKGGQPPIDPKSDLPENQTAAMARFKKDERAQKELSQTVKLADVKAEDFDTVFYVGGHGPLWDLAESPVSIALLESFYNSGKPIALVCHSPGVLRHVTYKGEPLVKGKRVTGFTNGEEEAVKLTKVVPFLVEDELLRLGATFEKLANWQPFSIVDGRLITGQNPASSTSAAQALLNLVGQKAASAS